MEISELKKYELLEYINSLKMDHYRGTLIKDTQRSKPIKIKAVCIFSIQMNIMHAPYNIQKKNKNIS